MNEHLRDAEGRFTTPRVNLNVGDEIVVNGHVFKLMEFSNNTGEPARVDFRQLVELIDRTSDESKVVGETTRAYGGWIVAKGTVTEEALRKALGEI